MTQEQMDEEEEMRGAAQVLYLCAKKGWSSISIDLLRGNQALLSADVDDIISFGEIDGMWESRTLGRSFDCPSGRRLHLLPEGMKIIDKYLRKLTEEAR